MNEPLRKRAKLSETIVNDIVHGIIKLPYHIQEIIDTVQFQRLRHIQQLGLTAFVYPSASYSRFEHSIGTFHLASMLMKQIQNQLVNELKDEDLLITDEELKCIEIAALCHDLGHGPYSHFWEHAFDDSIKTKQHEKLSMEIFLDLINSTKLNHQRPIKEEIKLNDKMIDLISRIILGNYNEDLDNRKKFLFEIVANKMSGLDVDKFDYLCRDSIYLGWSNKNKINEIKRIVHFFRVVKDETTNTWHLAMRDREIFNIHDVFYFRHLIHRRGCQHSIVKAVECMFRKALKIILMNINHRDELIENVMGERIQYDPSIWFSKEFISKVCDYHIWDIMKKRTMGIVMDIHERNLYKLCCQIRIEIKENIEKAKFLTGIFKLELFLNRRLNNRNVKLALSTFSLQSENRGDPLLHVKFYKKSDPSKCFVFNENTLPDLVKLKSSESILMIFSDKMMDEENSNILNTIKRKLCFDGYQDNDVIHDLRTLCTFKEINY